MDYHIEASWSSPHVQADNSLREFVFSQAVCPMIGNSVFLVTIWSGPKL